ncbi:PX domain-containing protein, partial [Tolypocladium capitatum]
GRFQAPGPSIEALALPEELPSAPTETDSRFRICCAGCVELKARSSLTTPRQRHLTTPRQRSATSWLPRQKPRACLRRLNLRSQEAGDSRVRVLESCIARISAILLDQRTSPAMSPADGDKPESGPANSTMKLPIRTNSSGSAPPPGVTLTGKQEHYLKRELMSQQVKWEINELNSPTALQRFGAPFRSEHGEVSPQESELPILRYIFVHHVRDFPFLDKAREKEFWQDKLQVFLESFAGKQISSSEDRLEETKRRKLAIKAQKLVELMMVSGIGTSSGFEERIRFSEIEIVDSNAIDTGVMHSIPEGNYINGWDVNVAGVRVTSVKRNIRLHKHAEFLLRIKRKGELEHFVGRRYGDFAKLYKHLRSELPGRVLPQLPKKNKSSSTASGIFSAFSNGDDSEVSSTSSVSTRFAGVAQEPDAAPRLLSSTAGQISNRTPGSITSATSIRSRASPRASVEGRGSPAVHPGTPNNEGTVVLWRENQRTSLRAWIRSLLHNPQVANTTAMQDFLGGDPITPTDEDVDDIVRRKAVDEKRIEEQKKFYEIARRRAAELDEYMEQFRRDIVERNGLTMLFKEIKEKQTIGDLSIQYRKFAEWLRIEVAAVIYHLFLAEDNSPEMFAQARRIHSLIPYSVIKNVIRIANPAAVMSGILDIFLAQPFGARSLMQRIFSLTLNDGIKSFQRSIDTLTGKIGDAVFTEKLQKYTNAEEDIKVAIREEAECEGIDLIVAILRSDMLEPELTGEQIQRLFNAYVAFNNAVENIDEELKQGAQLFSYLKQLLKLCTRQRDKTMMLHLIEEPVTLQLFRDLFTIFYEPLVRVYKSANVYNSVTDFAVFIDDMIQVVDKCREQDASADPNQTVQAFIDLCQRHEHNFYKFVHEVHTHDNGLFTQLMGWIEGILEFLRKGPTNGTLNVNALFEGGVSGGMLKKDVAIEEINSLIAWQEARKKWHNDKTRQKMAAEGHPGGNVGAMGMNFCSSDFGLDGEDLEDMAYDDGSEEEEEAEQEDELDPIEAERRRRAKQQDRLRRSAGEPVKPPVSEVHGLTDNFLVMLREVLAD